MTKAISIAILILSGMPAVSARTPAPVVWHSKASAVSSGTGNSQTSIYIKGSIKFSGSPLMRIQNSRIKLTGDFFNDVTRGTSGGCIFAPVAAGNQGILEFCGDAPQAISSSATTIADIPSKLENYINFPNVDINNSGHVTLDSRMAAKTNDIILSKGWLILDSQAAQANVDGGIDVNPAQESVLAHLLVDGTIDYKEGSAGEWDAKTPDEHGFIQVNLKIPADPQNTENSKSIVGFGIPFSQMYNDYFMFNTLLAPSNERFVGNGPLVDPKTSMTAGKGYVVGIDLRGTNPENYPKMEDYPAIDFNQRATDGYRFNRHNFAGYAPQNNVFGNDIQARKIEKLNTRDVKVKLTEGYNYLANPYTCPLNIDKLLGQNQAASTWKVRSDEWSELIDVWNRVWVLAPNSVAKPGWELTTSLYTYNYQVAMKTGGTYIDNDNMPGVTAIAPLQMFVIYSRKEMEITIPENERVMGTSRFLRNAPLENRRRDDFIIEFRDMETNTTDRASIVLRTQQEIDGGDYCDVERLESVSSDDARNTRMDRAQGEDFPQSMASQIYTKDAGGKPLTVQFLPLETTSRTLLYHIPSSKAQPLNILGLRLNTKERIGRIWLEDRKYNREIELTPQTVYQTESEPDDSRERFALRFAESSGLDEVEETDLIKAYDRNRTVMVEGFVGKSLGCIVELFDMNGRIIARKKANQYRFALCEEIIPGIYILKAHTSQPRTIKVLVR